MSDLSELRSGVSSLSALEVRRSCLVSAARCFAVDVLASQGCLAGALSLEGKSVYDLVDHIAFLHVDRGRPECDLAGIRRLSGMILEIERACDDVLSACASVCCVARAYEAEARACVARISVGGK
jgi:hypothetical protein